MDIREVLLKSLKESVIEEYFRDLEISSKQIDVVRVRLEELIISKYITKYFDSLSENEKLGIISQGEDLTNEERISYILGIMQQDPGIETFTNNFIKTDLLDFYESLTK